MKKRITSLLVIAALLLTVSAVFAFAEETEREYTYLGTNTAIINQRIAPYSKNTYEIPTGATNLAAQLTTTEDAEGNIKVSTGIILRYDISGLDVSSDKAVLTFGVCNRSSKVYSKYIEQDGIEFGIYALDCMKATWTQNDSWENISKNVSLPGEDFTKTKVGSFKSDDRTVHIDPVSAGSTLYGGYCFECDVSDYVTTQKKAGKSYVDLFLAIDKFDVTNSVYSTVDAETGTATGRAYFTMNTYSPDSNDTNGRSDPLRPRLHWYSMVRDEINTLESVSFVNGTLSGEFDKNSEEVFNVIVTDESQPVTITYELTSPLATVSDNAVTEGMAGDVLVIPVISEAGETRNYTFRLVSSGLNDDNLQAPTVNYVFKGKYYDVPDWVDGEYVFVFGTTNSIDGVGDVGINITDKTFNKYSYSFAEGEPEKISTINSGSGKFCFAIKDRGNFLNNTFGVKLFNVGVSKTVYGSSYLIDSVNQKAEAVEPGYAIATDALYFKFGSSALAKNQDSGLMIYEYASNNANYTNGVAYATMVRYDLTNVNTDASDIYVTIGSNKANSCAGHVEALSTAGNYIDVYEPAYTDISATWPEDTVAKPVDFFTSADVMPANLRALQSKYPLIDTIECGKDTITTEVDGSTVKSGCRVRANVTKSIKKAKAEGRSYIDLIFCLRADGVNNSISVKGPGYKYSDATAEDTKVFLPRVEWE